MSVKVLRYLEVLVVALMGGAMGYFLAEERPIAAVIAFAVGSLAAVTLNRIARREVLRSGAVLVDEMHYVIAEKTGLLAFKVSLVTIALLVFVAVLPAYVRLGLIPEGVRALYPGLGLSMAILAVSYWASYLYYSRSRKPIEGR